MIDKVFFSSLVLIFIMVSIIGAIALNKTFYPDPGAESLPTCTYTTIDKYMPCR